MSSSDQIFESFLLAEAEGMSFDLATEAADLDLIERRELEIRIALRGERSRPTPDDPTIERLERAARGLSGSWPSMLPRLRERASLNRSELTRELADRLGRPDDADRIDAYYHQLEWGNLPATKVDRSVVRGLAEILGTDEEELWEAGTSGMGGWSRRVRRTRSGTLPKRAFARLVGESKPLTVDDSVFDPPVKSDWDDTDRLFLGG